MENTTYNSKSDISLLQNEQLKIALEYLNSNSPFYKNLFSKNKTDIHKIKSLADLTQLPVTTKEDLQNYNWDFLCVDKTRVIEYCSTSGTLGNPVIIALTEKDLQRLAYNEYLSFINAGVNSGDIIHLMLSLDRQFMAGIAYYLGARKLEAGIIRGGPGNFLMHMETINRLKPTVLVAVPSFIVNFTVYAKEKNIDLNTTSVRKIICIGESIREENFTPNALATRITNSWNIELYSTYASTEQQTAFTECKEGKGGHHQPDLVIFEILDAQNQQLPPGEFGELTITTLGVEGMPLLRYKTGDICAYYNEQCACGRTTQRLSPVVGRKKQLIKFKGTTLYPQTIFNVLNSIEIIEDYVVDVTKNELGLDELRIHIALKNPIENHESKITHSLQSALRVVPEITYQEITKIHKMQLHEGKRKVNKFIDNR